MDESQPRWYRRVLRWGQTNLTEIDPVRYDAKFWRQQWRDTSVQGLIVNAGGIVAYYPSDLPLHHRAEHLGNHDLYGEIVEDARQEGLAVLARMDSNRADEEFYQAHPDWFTVDAAGQPYRAGDKYISCINSPYYSEYLPRVLQEIVKRSSPDGFADNSWAGLDRKHICYCVHCRERFQEAYDAGLPSTPDWDDPVYRQWIRWNYDRRIEVWEANNQVTQTAGGPECLWIGMVSGNLIHNADRFLDLRRIAQRAEILLLDHQSRTLADAFYQNAEAGKRLHGVLGWDKLIPESTAMYNLGQPVFRLASMPPAEARLWATEGFAGGIQPWWHHIGAYHDDRRQYTTAKPLFTWHRQHENFLVDRQPIAGVGVVWSQQSMDVHGRDDPGNVSLLPYRGVVRALVKARIPYLPVHVDDIGRHSDRLRVLVLPDVAAMSDEQCAAVRRFAAAGGAVVATGRTSLRTEDGELRSDFGLAELLGVHATGRHSGSDSPPDFSIENWARHSYLRLHPERRAVVDGPSTRTEPAVEADRHAVLDGLDDTDVVPFGGRIEEVIADPAAVVPLSFVPAFPIYPPETSWMREPSSDTPALVLPGVADGAGRVAYLAGDLDRCAGRDDQPDHLALLANIVRWAAGDAAPLEVTGPGLLDCNLYDQRGTRILHLGNVGTTSAVPGRQSDIVPVGPLQVRVRAGLPDGETSVRLLVDGSEVTATVSDGWVSFTVPQVIDHEVAIVG